MVINLLPTDLAPKGSIVKLASNLKKISVAGFVVFLISVVGLIIFFFFLSTQLNSSVARQDQLKSSIKSLEQVEQRLVLTKDRLDYTKQILARKAVSDDLAKMESLSAGLPADVRISQLDIDISKVELTFLATSSSGVSRSLAALLAADYYGKVVLESFGFNPTVGYMVNLELTNP